MNNKKRIIVAIISILLISIVGVTFAAYTYTRNGTSNSKQIVGDIYMHYRESNTLTLENAMPSSTYDSNTYFEFTIDGKNTNTKHDIYYDIILLRGDVPTGKTEENRILDKFIKFRLTEFIENETTHELEESEIFTNKKYSDLSNGKRVHVDTISKNTMNEISHRYRLYMWISNDVVIGNTENPSKDYDQLEWNNLFASIKVRATGDFEEKEVTTDASCFTTELITTGNTTLNTNMTSEELQACVQYTIDNAWQWEAGETAEAFCNGTGTNRGATFQEILDNDWFDSELLAYFQEHNIISVDEGVRITGYDSACGSEIIIPDELPSTSYTLNTNMTSEELQVCVDYLNNDFGLGWDTGETAEAFCGGTGTHWGDTFQESLDNGGFDSEQLAYFQEHNIIRNVSEEKYSVTTIGYDAFYSNQLTSVKLPSSVEIIEGGSSSDGCFGGAFANNLLSSVVLSNHLKEINGCAFANNQLSSLVIPNSVTTIGYGAFSNNQLTSVEIPNSVTTIEIGAFSDNQLTSVEIPNSVTTIGNSAFASNQLTSVEIPNSVTTIGYDAFSDNQLTSVEIPDSVTTIGGGAFEYNQLTSVEIPNSVTTIGKYAFCDNQLTSVEIPNSVTSIGISAFSHNQLTNVTIPNSVTTIEECAFNDNQLTSVTIPNSVTTIGRSAFYGNQLTSVTIGNGITSIGYGAFSKSNDTYTSDNGVTYYDNPNLASITIDKSCNDIKNNLKGYNWLSNLINYYPWLSDISPYTGIGGVTIYGSNNEVCDTF